MQPSPVLPAGLPAGQRCFVISLHSCSLPVFLMHNSHGPACGARAGFSVHRRRFIHSHARAVAHTHWLVRVPCGEPSGDAMQSLLFSHCLQRHPLSTLYPRHPHAPAITAHCLCYCMCMPHSLTPPPSFLSLRRPPHALCGRPGFVTSSRRR